MILLTGSAAAAGIAIWEHYKGVSIGSLMFSVIALSLLIVAFFRAWRDEHTARLNEQSERISIESELSKTRMALEAERSKRKLEDVQASVAEIQLEKLTVEKAKQEAQEKHDERIRFLTAPNTGIRFYAAEQVRLRRLSAAAFTVEQLVQGMCAKQDEIEEALRVLRGRGHAKETSLPGHWYIS